MLSVQSNPACPSRADAERAVNEVWESCFNDTRPFDEVRCGMVVAILQLTPCEDLLRMLFGNASVAPLVMGARIVSYATDMSETC